MKPLSVTVDQCCDLIGIGKTTFYRIAGQNKLTLLKIGRRTLVTMDSIEALIRDAQTDGGE
jgi:excisionase family DNA binding protein